jgi:HAD superfamily hydrolase (TIGR01509 family)
MTDLSECKAVIFDVDGTLYDPRSLRRGIMMRFAAAYWKQPLAGLRAASILRAYRNSHEELRGNAYSEAAHLDLAAKKSGASASQIREIVAQWMETAPLGLLPLCVYPEAVDLLQKLEARGIPCGIFSDYPATKKLEAMKLSGFFKAVVCANDVGRLKPDPRGLLAVLKTMNVAAGKTVYIGDRTIDQEAATQAGMESILIRNAADYSELLRGWPSAKPS